MIKLFVSGFPLDITEMDLAMLMSPHGDIVTIKIVRDTQTRKCKGYAFVEMASLTDAENAVIALDGLPMNDRELTVKINEEKPVIAKPRYRKPAYDLRTPPVHQKSMERHAAINESPLVKRPRRPRV